MGYYYYYKYFVILDGREIIIKSIFLFQMEWILFLHNIKELLNFDYHQVDSQMCSHSNKKRKKVHFLCLFRS